MFLLIPIVQPGAAQSLSIESLPNNCLKFGYKIPRQMRHFPYGLVQDIRYRSKWSDEWTQVDTSGWNLEVVSSQNFANNLMYVFRMILSHLIFKTCPIAGQTTQ